MNKSMWAWLESASYSALMWAKNKEQTRIKKLGMGKVNETFKYQTWQEALSEGPLYVKNVIKHKNSQDDGFINDSFRLKDEDAYIKWLQFMFLKGVQLDEMKEFSVQYRDFCGIYNSESLKKLNDLFVTNIPLGDGLAIPRLIWSSIVQSPEELLNTQLYIADRGLNLKKDDVSAWDWSKPSLKTALIQQLSKLYPTSIDKETLQNLCTKYKVTRNDISLFDISRSTGATQLYMMAQVLAGKDAIWYALDMRESTFKDIFKNDPLFTVAKAWQGIALTEEERKINPVSFALYNERYAPTLRELTDPLPPTWTLANELSGTDPIAFCRFIETSYNSQYKMPQIDLDFDGRTTNVATPEDPINSNFFK